MRIANPGVQKQKNETMMNWMKPLLSNARSAGLAEYGAEYQLMCHV